MKNKVIRGVLAAACVTTAVSAANVFGAGTEQSLVNEASAVTQEETEETSEAETTDENTPEMTETETPDSTAENAASDLPAAEVQSGKSEETAVSVQAGSYYPWVNENGIWYFKDPDGTIVKGAWREYDKNRYYLNNDGKMAVGWKKLDGAWYYFQSWGGVYRDAFYTVKNVPYYSDADGKMATGWKLIDDVYYYFDDQGAMYRNRFFEYDKNTYYVDADGKMASGFEQIDGIWYYFRSWGGIYKDTYIDGYYVDKNGVRRNSKNICVAIDAGHQRRGNSEKEPIGPGSSTYKAKVASGTCGVATSINEYELNLAVSLKVRDILEERGYDVYMIRETHDVNISNSERAKLAAQNGADILVRVHANGDSNQSVYGALTMAPSSRNTYLSGDVISKSQKLSQKMIAAFCKDTGAKNRDVIYTDSMSGINWSTIPVTIIELGFMSNPSEDRLMATEDYRNKMAQGIADGIDAYYE